MNNARIIFAGTPEFAAAHLRALLDAGIKPVAVYTQPDRPAGRGQQAQSSAVKNLALAHGICVEQPLTLKEPTAQKVLHSYAPDILIVVAYGLLLPQVVLDMPHYGCVNVHASLLPRWRGAAPIQRALLAGDHNTGVELMRMEAGLDTGPIFASASTAIATSDTAATLHDRLAQLGASLLLDNLAALVNGTLTAHAQAQDGVTYAKKIDKAEACIDWAQSAQHIDRQIRAFNPFPIAYTNLQGELVKIHQAEIVPMTPSEKRAGCLPGTIVALRENAFLVCCAEESGDSQALAVSVVQLPGGKRLSVAELIRGKRDYFAVGKHFDSAPSSGVMA